MDLPLTATDTDNNVLEFSATGLPPGLSVDPVYGDIVGHADYGDEADSPYHVTVTASNGYLSGSQSFLWTITPAAPSIDNADDPQWDDMNNAEGEFALFGVQASDPNGLPLTYSATNLPPGVTIDPEFGLISGTVAPGADTGTPYDVTIAVSNGSQTSTLEFPWTITQVSLPAQNDRISFAGQFVSLPIQAGVPPGLSPTYSADGLPDGLAIDPVTGVISGTVADSAADAMPWPVTIDVTDGAETAERTFNWTIAPTSIPTVSLANPGDQANNTDDVISLPIQATASAPDTLYYSATGLPTGLDIDPDTGVISGMDDDFNAAAGTVYAVTVTLTDEFGQTASQSFNWQFNADPAGPPALGPFAAGASASSPNGVSPLGEPGQHPTTEARTDAFDVNAFWSNVEKLPGGQAAENWVADHGGKVEWAWLGITTLGRYEKQADGTSIPVVYIPQRYNEAGASEAFVNNITQTWDGTGFAAESKVPTDGNPADWQEYIKQRTAAMGSVVTTGAELYLSGLSIVNEGADWVVTINDVASAKTPGQAAVAAVAFLPFISGSTLKVLKKGLVVVQASEFQQKLIKKFFKDYDAAGFGSKFYEGMVSFQNAIVLQRSDVIFNQEQVVSMMRGNAPWAWDVKASKFDQIQLHHVDQYPESGGVIAEVFGGQNSSPFLHPGNNGADNTSIPWKEFRIEYWRNRLQMGINNGWIAPDIINKYRPQLIANGFQLP